MAGGCPREGWDRISLGMQLLEATKSLKKGVAGSYYQPTHSRWQHWQVKEWGAGAPPASHIDLWPSLFLEFSREGWQGWGLLA